MHAHQLSILIPHPAVPDHHSNKDQTYSLTSCVHQQSIGQSVSQSIACVQTSPLPQEKSGETSVNRRR